MPPFLPAIQVQVHHRSPLRLHPPVLAIAPVLPPPTLDPPPPDDVADLVSPASPKERGGHPRVPLHRHHLLVELGHAPGLVQGRIRTYVRVRFRSLRSQLAPVKRPFTLTLKGILLHVDP